METEKMTYSYKAVAECEKLLNDISMTVNRKATHFIKAAEIRKVSRKCLDLTNCLLFDPDWNPQITDYSQNAGAYEDFSKKELDRQFRLLMLNLKGYVRDIKREMDAGILGSRP